MYVFTKPVFANGKSLNTTPLYMTTQVYSKYIAKQNPNLIPTIFSMSYQMVFLQLNHTTIHINAILFFQLKNM